MSSASRREYHRQYHLRTRDKKCASVKQWQSENREKVRANDARWKKSNSEKVNASRRKWFANNPSQRLANNLRNRVRGVLQGKYKSAKTVELLGCSIESFSIYLESKFESGMTWENYGTKWEIDHIMPCAIFDLTKPEHQRRCFHFSNYQPLPISENRSKGAKVLSDQFQLL